MPQPTEQQQQDLMDAFFETHQYNEHGDWRATPATNADPIDDDTEPSKE